MADRWNGYLRRRGDARVNRAELVAIRHGLLPDGWVYGLHDQRQAEYDEQRHIFLEMHKYLYREPVSGPDGIPVAVWYAGADGYRAPVLVLNAGWPSAPRGRLSVVAGYCVRVLNNIVSVPRLSFVVQAHAMSGPPATVIRGFQSKQDAAAFAARLVQQVRTSGIGALAQDT
jgi:hypothetical protein